MYFMIYYEYIFSSTISIIKKIGNISITHRFRQISVCCLIQITGKTFVSYMMTGSDTFWWNDQYACLLNLIAGFKVLVQC